MEFEELDDLYQEIILDHHKHPRNHQLLACPDLQAEGYNPFCGDQVVLTAALDSSRRISAVGINGQGCAISQASASIMSELLKGRTLEEAQSLHARFRGIMQDQAATEADEEDLGELTALEGVKKFPIRIKCALLAWSALQDAITEYRKG